MSSQAARNRWAQIHRKRRAARKTERNKSSGYKFKGPCCPKCEKEWRARLSGLL